MGIPILSVVIGILFFIAFMIFAFVVIVFFAGFIMWLIGTYEDYKYDDDEYGVYDTDD